MKDYGPCIECGADWRGEPIPEESRRKGYYGDPAPTHYSRLIGIEVPGLYDGVSFWRCPDCGATWDRWSGHMVDELPKIIDDWRQEREER